jgi:hypothetical protein
METFFGNDGTDVLINGGIHGDAGVGHGSGQPGISDMTWPLLDFDHRP